MSIEIFENAHFDLFLFLFSFYLSLHFQPCLLLYDGGLRFNRMPDMT